MKNKMIVIGVKIRIKESVDLLRVLFYTTTCTEGWDILVALHGIQRQALLDLILMKKKRKQRRRE